MKLVSFLKNNTEMLGLYYREVIYDLSKTAERFNIDLPDNMLEFLWGGQKTMNLARECEDKIRNGIFAEPVNRKEIQMLAPVPHPT